MGTDFAPRGYVRQLLKDLRWSTMDGGLERAADEQSALSAIEK